MAVQLRFSQGTTVGDWGMALETAASGDVAIEGQATGTTTIASWQILAHVRRDMATPSSPSSAVVVASGTSAIPTATVAPPAAGGSHLYELRTWATAGGTGDSVSDYREIGTPLAATALRVPAPVVDATLQTALRAQVASGGGRHDNFDAYAWGWSSEYASLAAVVEAMRTELTSTTAAAASAASAAATAQGAAESAASSASTALANAATAQSAADDAQATADAAATATALASLQSAFDAIATPQALEFSAAVPLDQSGSMTFSGSSSNVTLTAGEGTRIPGVVVSVLFPAGTITGSDLVALDPSLHPPADAADGTLMDRALNYRIMIAVLADGQVVSSARVEVLVDSVPPTITEAFAPTVALSTVIVRLSESVAWTTFAGFTITGHTIDSMSGSGASRALAISPALAGGEAVDLVFDGSDVVADPTGNRLAAGSTAITVGVDSPTIVSAAVDADVFTLVMSEACDVSTITGLSLSGTAAEFATYTSGSGSTTLLFALDALTVAGETITFDLAATNGIASAATGLHPEAATGVEVTNNTSAGGDVLFWSDDFERPDGPLDNGWTLLGWATGSLSGGALVVGDYGGEYAQIANDIDAPSGMHLEFTIPHAALAIDLWGMAIRYNTNNSTGPRLLYGGGSFFCGSASNSNGDAEITVTGGFPASWSVDQPHTVGLRAAGAGTTIQIMVDGQEYGTFTQADNAGVDGLGVAYVGEGRGLTILGVVVRSAG